MTLAGRGALKSLLAFSSEDFTERLLLGSQGDGGGGGGVGGGDGGRASSLVSLHPSALRNN